ncbi:MAG: hypothetical protein ACOX7H_05995 [Bacillota bacterium]|jgi:hypothetical protein
MFPLVHHYCNKAIMSPVDNTMILGGLFPDLALNAGIWRNTAHTCGLQFYNWCQQNCDYKINFIKGILSHGTEPLGLDYYADEFWPEGERGYCFQQGLPWLDRVRQATQLPEKLIWWKSHNFVEMAFELISIEKDPLLGQEILNAIEDKEAVEEVCRMVQEYFGVDKKKMINAYALVPEIFALDDTSPLKMARKQYQAFIIRHKEFNANVEKMTLLLEDMRDYFRDKFDPFMNKVNRLVQDMVFSII